MARWMRAVLPHARLNDGGAGPTPETVAPGSMGEH